MPSVQPGKPRGGGRAGFRLLQPLPDSRVPKSHAGDGSGIANRVWDISDLVVAA